MSTNTFPSTSVRGFRSVLLLGAIILFGVVTIVILANFQHWYRLVLVLEYDACFYPRGFLAFIGCFFFLYLLFLLDTLLIRRSGWVGGWALLVLNLLCLLMVYQMGPLFKGLLSLWGEPGLGDLSPYRTTYSIEVHQVGTSAILWYSGVLVALQLSLMWSIFFLYRQYRK